MNEKISRYEDFGAVGDGKHDDLPAIVACHEYANKHGARVVARDDATYYIGGKSLTATIKTSTNFGKAKFIIDDTTLENIKSDVFQICSDHEVYTADILTLSKNQKRVDFLHTGKAYVRVFNDKRTVYIRKGLNRDNGSAASDAFIVDYDGFILTDINWDYESVTGAYARSVEDEPITVEGGFFTTVANQAESFYNYHKRGIHTERSNVTIRGLAHYVVGEGDHGAPYNGFISVGECYNFTIEDCLLTPHRTYCTEGVYPGSVVSMGTYDFNLSGTIGVTMRNVTQTIDITDSRYWGIIGTNFSKDVLIENCVISRYDAHCGVTNATIRNTTLGYHGLNLIGFGTFSIENSTVQAYSFINLRDDYGSFFNGSLSIKNCVWVPSSNNRTVFNAVNSADHDFGYECGMPRHIQIDGFTIADSADNSATEFYLFPEYDKQYAPNKPFAYGIPEVVEIENLTVASGKQFALAENPELYTGLSIKGL
ncbi:MAG: hypothetical protein IJ515_06650 [Clostridia bacterium]|nr:hypothetical protein [Clostridia bacterium]